MKKFKVAIIGMGLIGKKRASNLGSQGELVAYSDIKKSKLEFLKKNVKKIKFFKNWNQLLRVKSIDIIIISTVHNKLAEIMIEAIKHKKHILVEKPAAIRLLDLKNAIKLSKKNKNKIRVGYNHRFHAAILKSKHLINEGLLGQLMFIKSSYGHGARIGYHNEWRMNPKISGGGELIDQGSHLIDLSIYFFGKVKKVIGVLESFFWKKKVDDNCFVTIQFDNNCTSFFHASCTEWKNNFLFEIYGKKGKIKIEGKGGSYGAEKLIYYKMGKEMGPPLKKVWRFPSPDFSWRREINELYKDITLDRKPKPSLEEAYEVLKIIKKIYTMNKL
jgi:predicted dehydrogenase